MTEQDLAIDIWHDDGGAVREHIDSPDWNSERRAQIARQNDLAAAVRLMLGPNSPDPVIRAGWARTATDFCRFDTSREGLA